MYSGPREVLTQQVRLAVGLGTHDLQLRSALEGSTSTMQRFVCDLVQLEDACVDPLPLLMLLHQLQHVLLRLHQLHPGLGPRAAPQQQLDDLCAA